MTAVTNPLNTTTSTIQTQTNPNATLSKSAFMQLLLTEMQHQDPTSPMDSTKILTQTSQLATLESADKTNKTLASLSKALQNSQQFSMISAIGKTASLGNDTIVSGGKGIPQKFELYFPSDVKNGKIKISNESGQVIDTIKIGKTSKGVYSYTWNGKNSDGSLASSGTYHVDASYINGNNISQSTKLGVYPIEALKFNGTDTLVKLGSQYLPFTSIKEVY